MLRAAISGWGKPYYGVKEVSEYCLSHNHVDLYKLKSTVFPAQIAWFPFSKVYFGVMQRSDSSFRNISFTRFCTCSLRFSIQVSTSNTSKSVPFYCWWDIPALYISGRCSQFHSQTGWKRFGFYILLLVSVAVLLPWTAFTSVLILFKLKRVANEEPYYS